MQGLRQRTVSYVAWKDNVATSTMRPIDPAVSVRSFTDFVFNAYLFGRQPPSKKAIVEGDSFRTFGDLSKDVGTIRRFVTEDLKLKKGDIVTLVTPNHVDYFSVVHGFCSAGVAVSPANPAYTHQEIEHQLKKSKSKAVVAHTSCFEATLKAAKGAGVGTVVVLEDDDGNPAQFATFPSISRLRRAGKPYPHEDPSKPVVASGADLAILPFSSGTTGLPKGTMLSHSNLCANLAQLDCESQFFRDDDVIISPLPMFHIYAFTISMNLTIMQGKTLVTMKKFDLDRFCHAVQEHKCSRGHVVPPIILNLCKSSIVDKYNMKSLRMLMSAAAPLGADQQHALMQRFPGIICKQAWGMSELSPIGTIELDNDTAKPGTVGPPVGSTQIKVVDGSGKALPPNAAGELCVRGPQVMQGYLDEPEKTRQCLSADGWLSTGDIARIDEDGCVYITDRLKELIKYKGFQVAPAELEALLLTHPAILDVVVIPRPDTEADEVPRAYVVLKPGATAGAEEIIEWAAKQTTHYKKLRGGVIFADSIPKTASGKILRREVVALDRAKYPASKL